MARGGSTATAAAAAAEAETETETASVCDVFISYDRDANGGEGPDCPMCKVHRLHGSYDKVFVMRVSLSYK